MTAIRCNRCYKALYGDEYKDHYLFCFEGKATSFQKKRSHKERKMAKTIRSLKKQVNALKSERKTSEHPFYGSERWKALRYATLKKYGFKCMACKQTDKVLHVDHIKPRSVFPELEWNEDNLQVLCLDCNIGKSNVHYDDFRSKT